MSLQCLAAKIPVVLVAFTAHHATLLKKQILQKLWSAMTDSSCAELFEIGLARIVNKAPAVDGQANPDSNKGTKKRTAEDVVADPTVQTKKTRGRGRGSKGRPSPGIAAAADKARKLLLTKLGKSAEGEGSAPAASGATAA